MLHPNKLAHYPDALVKLYEQAETDILKDMARRISTYDYFIPAAEWQFRKLQDMGNLHDDILNKLSQLTGKTEKELRDLMKTAGFETLDVDDEIYKKAGFNPLPIAQSEAMQAIIGAGYDKTKGLFQNLTRTTAQTATQQFEQSLDRAYMQITSGAFSADTAIRTAVKDLARQGLASIKYPTGHVDYIETCVRRAVITGVNQTALKMQDARAAEIGCDLVETSAHAGARPEHAIWQGRIFSRSGAHLKYPDFVKSTGYGTGEGLGGWNCRHSFYPFFEGISTPAYTQADLDEMDAPKYEYNGKKLTESEAESRQRGIERQIRKWKREYVGMAAAGQPIDEAASKIAHWQRVEKDFLKQTGLKKQSARSQIGAYGKSEAKKVQSNLKQQVTQYAEQHISSVAQADVLQSATNSSIINAAKRFSSRHDADKLFRPWTEQVWPSLNMDERYAAFEYTSGSGKFNRPLRGYDRSWDEGSFLGIGNVSLDNEGAGHMIQDLKEAIDKSDIQEDVWLFRGSDQQSLAGLLGIDKNKIIPSNVTALNAKFAGKDISDPAFMSTGIAADAGFNDKIAYEILAPKGTKGIYAEPFSYFGNTNTDGDWDGFESFSDVSSEAEVILQAGTGFTIKEIKLVAQKITVVLQAFIK